MTHACVRLHMCVCVPSLMNLAYFYGVDDGGGTGGSAGNNGVGWPPGNAAGYSINYAE